MLPIASWSTTTTTSVFHMAKGAAAAAGQLLEFMQMRSLCQLFCLPQIDPHWWTIIIAGDDSGRGSDRIECETGERPLICGTCRCVGNKWIGILSTWPGVTVSSPTAILTRLIRTILGDRGWQKAAEVGRGYSTTNESIRDCQRFIWMVVQSTNSRSPNWPCPALDDFFASYEQCIIIEKRSQKQWQIVYNVGFCFGRRWF